MQTFTEILPARKASSHSALQWLPVDDEAHPQVAGVLTISTDRSRHAYQVSEFPTGWTGRGFTLAKLTTGTDPTAESYSVFCNPSRPAAASCDCRGHQRFDTCKHCDSICALLANGWL